MPETVESRGIPVLGKDILEWSFWGWTVKITLLAESVTGQPFNKLLSDLFNDFGATSAGSIALTVDGTTSPAYGISATLRLWAFPPVDRAG